MLVQDWRLPALKLVFMDISSHVDMGNGHVSMAVLQGLHTMPGTLQAQGLPGAHEPHPTIDPGSVFGGLICFHLEP